MTTAKTYSSRSNAKRAARAELGSDAQEGMDFHVVHVEGSFTWERIVTAAESSDTTSAEGRPDPIEDQVRIGEAIMDVVRDIRAAESKGPVTPRAGSKIGALIERARSPEGLTYADIRQATGWSKLGGFFTAAKRAGLVLHGGRERIDGERDTRFFAVPEADVQAGRVYAYFCGPDGRWVPCGDYADEDEAVRFAQAEAPEGVAVTAERGRRGELYLYARETEQEEAAA